MVPAGASSAGSKGLDETLASEIAAFAPSASEEQETKLLQLESDLKDMCERACTQVAGQNFPVMVELLRLGSLQLGVALTDEVNFVCVTQRAFQLPLLLAALQKQLEQPPLSQVVLPPGPDGLFDAPGLCFSLQGMQVKLLLAQRIPGLPDPSPDSIVQSMSALYAWQVNAQILAGVPNVDNFRQLFSLVRHWAKQRGIYGGLFGFLHGTAWAICSARICQMNPSLGIFELVEAFFQRLSRWDWRQPVMLLPAGAKGHAPEAPPGEMLVGSSMLVRLPVGQNLSATVGINESAMRATHEELCRAYKAVRLFQAGKAELSELWANKRFFQRHRHYLQLNFMASTEEVMGHWLAFARLQLQELMQIIESMGLRQVLLRPWPAWVPFKDSEWSHSQAAFVGLQVERGPDDQKGGCTIDLREIMVQFLEKISAFPEASKYANQFDLHIKSAKLSELQEWLACQGQTLQ
eukprot:TRINITY_DN32938_c0_g1_i1.p1 TRINITY_DN32938_c0_g1~~TRINITY_DN32938_c0_g1_i1.p1  ORF type:complete len:464 (+),score=106.85 TRINITY_DN32938_c0_g1_i1:49-1440(+)